MTITRYLLGITVFQTDRSCKNESPPMLVAAVANNEIGIDIERSRGRHFQTDRSSGVVDRLHSCFDCHATCNVTYACRTCTIP